MEALLLPTQVITQANVQDVIDAGALKADEVCKGIESDCEASASADPSGHRTVAGPCPATVRGPTCPHTDGGPS